MRLLLVEDDDMIAENILDGLRGQHYAVDWATSGPAAEWEMATAMHDLVLLDLGLPGKPGVDILTALRRAGNTVPVLIITARGDLRSRIEGLDAGADDYLVKPFDIDELFARIRMLLRRRANRASSIVVVGALRVNIDTHEAQLDGVPLHLPPMEFRLLHALLDQPGKVVSKRQLEARLYGPDEEVESNAVDVFVSRLRKKLGAGFIRTVRGVGYRVPTAP